MNPQQEKTGQSTLGQILTGEAMAREANEATLGERGVALIGETNQNVLGGNSLCKPDVIAFLTVYHPWYTGTVTTKS